MTTGIYLDNNATTMVAPEIVEEMLPYFTEQFGNPSSLHQFGNKVGRVLKQARKQVQALLGAEHDSEIIFTSCGTESDSTAILSALKAQPDRKEIITTVVEHPAVLSLCEYLEKEGYTVHYLKVDKKGRLDMQEYISLLSDNVAIVSIMWANNESGTLFPIEEMAVLARSAGVMFHTDAVQAVGKIPMNLKDSGIDMLSLSGHKLHAPKGIGILYLRRGVRFRPLLRGGHQERGRRAGTENAASIVGLGKACEMAQEAMSYEKSTVKAMRDRLEHGILEAVSYCFVTGDPNNRLPNTCNIAFEYIEGEAILLLLNKMGIAASSGSACTSGSLEPSHVMRAMDIPFTAAHGSVRFSFSRYNTMEEVEKVIEAVPPIVTQLRKLSPYWDGNGPVEEPEKAFAPSYA
ncbi:MAG: cysteine desulfurase NifS [gamma proteobacterium symbiont of Bathyaustriella thionipta]|nr:cysteine desulfurase NifS [gamma proteobacterium symbiont of Bathyaustriella thionipta]MCU7950230.1 cysteine desulfurase NifS [gamma proteobacterium symbiont of Bathyaustriella thionipta]MCU7952166.1 cysteine desulfurase NifS [gamma proteobacterium symbiont of Bathyaustriella thionipta]MCU7956765.1 cysteine desulfurase NifS [gamma proteobacterium symbiont of Bathyaustriella thionipta]MCU7968895.1 cysteine desulfurase NifS [gamma proteobacterium symbiont of Bathyaustriella thionipta]